MAREVRTARFSHRQRAATGWLILAAAAAFLSAAEAADWPQWRGPQRNGISAERGLKPWGGAGPKRLWSAQIGEGYSSVAVAGGRVYAIGNANGRDTVTCLDANTGRQLWKHSYRQAAGDYTGPRATPAVDGRVVYTLSRDGIACSLDAATGRPHWTKDLRKDLGLAIPQWGFAGSPLVYGGKIIYNVGTAGVALDGTSKVVWKSGAGHSGYASPVPYNINGKKGVALFTAKSVVGVDPNNGRIQWQHPWETSYDVNSADPIISGNTVFISSNYNKGGALLQINGTTPTVLWQNRNMRNHFNSCVLLGGALFGNDENTLKCIDHKTGAERWRMRGGLGKGGLIAADGKLIVLTERGELILANAVSSSYQELARTRVMNGECWTQPVLSGGKIYCRSHQGELICLDVS